MYTQLSHQIHETLSLVSMKVRDVIKLLRADGWYLARVRGSHRQYKHAKKKGLVTVPDKPNDDLARGTLLSIFKQAGWR